MKLKASLRITLRHIRNCPQFEETIDEIIVTITRQQRDAIVTLLDQFFVVLEYRNVVFEKAVKKAAKKADDI